MQPSILIADDHPLVLKGLQDFLIEKGYNVICSETNGKHAYDSILKNRPDIAVLDIRMPLMTGIEIAEACRDNNIKTKIILITFEKDESLYKRAISLDVSGYILKEFALVEIENCIKAVNNGELYFSEQLTEYLCIEPICEEFKLLTPTEQEITKHIAQNKTGVAIAEILCISSRTVEKHKSNIIKKLNLPHKQNSLLVWAKENEAYILKNT
ncbi:MAG: response regulator transcription factor [Flavobacteriaceae bacterium]|nr:response regulator transcription factor [Flavobacteriaceae bacterium]